MRDENAIAEAENESQNVVKRYQHSQKISLRIAKKEKDVQRLHVPRNLVQKLNQQKAERAQEIVKYQYSRFADLIAG